MTFSILWQFLYYGWVVSELAVAIGTRTRRDRGNVRDRGTLYLLWAVIFTSMTVGLSWTDMRTFGNVPGVHWMIWFALALFVFGFALRWIAIFSLGKSFSSNVAIHSTQKLNQSGLFRVVRHPSYTGLLLIFLAMGLDTHNWLGLGLIVLLPAAALLYRIHVEEAALAGAFGAEYVAYSRRVKRLIPGIY